MKITREEIATVLFDNDDGGSDPNKLTLSAGKFTFRKGWYWRPRKTTEEQFKANVAKLIEAGYVLSDIEYGEVNNPFRGGQSVKNNSHSWMKFKIKKAEKQNQTKGFFNLIVGDMLA